MLPAGRLQDYVAEVGNGLAFTPNNFIPIMYVSKLSGNICTDGYILELSFLNISHRSISVAAVCIL